MAPPKKKKLVSSTHSKAVVGCTARIAMAAGVVASSVALVGCHEPECAGSRLDEIFVHGKDAIRAAGSLELEESIDQLGYATGIAAHPYYYLAPITGTTPTGKGRVVGAPSTAYGGGGWTAYPPDVGTPE